MVAEIEWTIENISCWNADIHGKAITGPESENGYLELYPRGYSGKEESIEVHLPRNVRPVFFRTIERGVCIYPGSNGSPVQATLTQNVPSVCFEGPKFDDIVANIRQNEAVVQDKITLRLVQAFTTVTHYRSHIDVHDTRVKTSADTFKNVSYRTNQSVFRIVYNLEGDREECVNVLSSTLSYTLGVATVQLFLESECHSNVFSVHGNLSFLLPEGTEGVRSTPIPAPGNTYSARHTFRRTEIWEFYRIKVSERTEGTFVLRLKFVSVPKCLSSELTLPRIQVSDHGFLSEPGLALSGDLTWLFRNKDFSDIQLRCGNSTFRAHKAILSARSLTFRRHLASVMTTTTPVDISDMNAPTLARFLLFLYSGTLGENMDWEVAIELYKVAHRYMVPSLENASSLYLIQNASTRNICDVLSVADKYQDWNLVVVVCDFILDNFDEVLRSPEWAALVKDDSMVTSRTLTFLANKNRIGKRIGQ